LLFEVFQSKLSTSKQQEDTHMTKMVEVLRNNVTVAQFLRYVQAACEKQGLDRGFSRDDFEHPHNPEHSSYHVVDGVKHCHFEYYRTVTHWGRKLFSNELYTYEETELARVDQKWPGEDAPCKAETYRCFAYDFQVYMLCWDGTCYNEICEFTFDDDQRGHGYYYQVNKDADAA